MNDEASFLAAICAEPGDDTRRLAFADWLDEHDQPDRAEFIRVQIELAKFPESEEEFARLSGPDRKRYHDLFAIETCLFATDDARTLAWFELPRPWARVVRLTPFDEEPDDYPYAVARRGFLERLTCTSDSWLAFHHKIRRQPVAAVVLTTRPVFACDATEAWLTEDPDGVRVPWSDLRAELRKGDGCDYLFPLLRCRYRGVEFELPDYASETLVITRRVANLPDLIRPLGRVNSVAFRGFRPGELLLTNVKSNRDRRGFTVELTFRPTPPPPVPGFDVYDRTDFNAILIELAGEVIE